MLVTLLLIVCLDVSSPGSCENARVLDSDHAVGLTMQACSIIGLPTAIAFKDLDPKYSRPQWKFGGYLCVKSERGKAA